MTNQAILTKAIHVEVIFSNGRKQTATKDLDPQETDRHALRVLFEAFLKNMGENT